MPIENSKAHEIKRLTTPLTFKDSKAMDSNGKVLNCVETLHDVRYIVEPREGILSEDEILQYAPQSRSASRIRLKRGFGDISDVLLIHESLPAILGLFYVVLICVSIPVIYVGNRFAMLFILILFIIPLIYMYRAFNLNSYAIKEIKKQTKRSENKIKTPVDVPVTETKGLESLKKYEKKVNDLKILFEVKEQVVRDLVKKRFEPPQITYDKFINIIDNSHKLFYSQSDAALNIINLAADDTPRVENEIESKIDAMKTIINQIEKLTNELVINISNEDGATDEVKNLLEEMENLTKSIKEY